MAFRDLTTKEYADILRYYNLPIPKQSQQVKLEAEKIITAKLCGCIRSIARKNAKSKNNVKNETSVGVCTKTVINNKGFSRGNFACKKPKRSVTLKKKIHKNKNSKKTRKSPKKSRR